METVVLKNGSWQAAVWPGFGCNMISVRVDGRELMRVPESMEQLERNRDLFGFPLILPANRTAGGRFTFRGREYDLGINEPARGCHLHGHLLDAPFAVAERTDSRLVTRLENRGERYPFSFDMTVTDTVSPDGVCRELVLRALEDMPYTLGFHTTFLTPARFDVPRGPQCVRDEWLIPTGRWVGPLPLGESFDTCFRSAGTTAVLDDIRFTVSDNFDHWVLYNADGRQGFLCVEPQCGQINGLNVPGGCRELAAGEEAVFRFTLSVKE